MRKELLTVGTNHNKVHKFFIMGDHGQIEGTPYFNTMKECMIEIFRMSQGKGYTNIYDMSQGQYEELTNNS